MITTHFSKQELQLKCRNIKKQYYKLLLIDVLLFIFLYISCCMIPQSPTILKIVLCILVIGFYIAHIVIARCPVCGNFLVSLLFLIWFPNTCHYCGLNLKTGELPNPNKDK